ncbi:MAG: hypothetical protein ACI4M9_03915 [Succinivibrio sp.]
MPDMNTSLTVSQITGELDRIVISINEIRRKLLQIEGEEAELKYRENDVDLPELKRVAALCLAQEGGKPFVSGLLNRFNSKKLSELKPIHYRDFSEELKKWLDIPF